MMLFEILNNKSRERNPQLRKGEIAVIDEFVSLTLKRTN